MAEDTVMPQGTTLPPKDIPVISEEDSAKALTKE